MWQYLGLAALLLATVWALATLIAEWLGERHNRQRRALELELLRSQLETERERRKAGKHSAAPWNGFRKFVVKRKVMEAAGQCSFYLAPHDRKPLLEFKAGQYLTFQLLVPGQGKPVVRCYSLSERPEPDHYRVTIKRLAAPAGADGAPDGVGSGYFHDHVAEGDILDVKAPAGHFHLEPAGAGGLVLVGGGIGITPMLSMLRTLAALQSRREVWLFYGIRDGREHLMRELMQTTIRENPTMRLVVCYSRPAASDAPGEHYDHQGRVSVELFKTLLPSNNYDFYLCGPGEMMETLTVDLKKWGVPESRLHFETFGPSSVRRVGATQAPMPFTSQCAVTFKRSSRTVPWTGTDNSLLDLAERHGVTIASGCRAGNCGTCLVAIQSGDVNYLQPPGASPDPGTCLTCLARPQGDLVLDA